MSNKIKNQEILFSPGSTYWGDVWLQFKKHKGALLGAIIFFGIVITVMLGPKHNCDDNTKKNNST